MRRGKGAALLLLLTAAGSLLMPSATIAARPAYPPTAKKPVTNTYHGEAVVDDYQWLEDASDLAVKAWVATQNAFSRAALDALPHRAAIGARLEELYATQTSSYSGLRTRPGILFAMKSQPPKQQSFLVAMDGPDRVNERVVVDPTTLDPTGATSIDFYAPSLDGSLVAVSLSRAGSEDGTVHVFEVATGRQLPDAVPRVNFPTAGGSVTWDGGAKGFWYTRYPASGERPDADLHFYQQVYYHKLGTGPASDRYEVGKEFLRIAETTLQTSDSGDYVLASVKNGDGGEVMHWLRGPDGQWSQLTQFADQMKAAVLGPDDIVYFLSHKDAPNGKIFSTPAAPPKTGPRTFQVEVPEGSLAIAGFVPTDTRTYVTEMDGGPSRLRIVDVSGRPMPPVPTPEISSVGAVVRTSGDSVLFYNESYTVPGAWFAFDAATGRSTKTKIFRTSNANFDDAEVVRVMAPSKDGTQVPLNIIRKRGVKLDGSHPVLLTGYGGYGSTQAPGFNTRVRMWLDHGGIWAHANLRGGGEYGEAWHLAGNLTKKQNVFDDLAGCAQWLIKNGYTSPNRLAIEGGSNGGLLMGAALTQHPELFRAVVGHVGIYDSLRVELTPNGAFNVTEFGTVRDPDQYRALRAYSPYHNVKDGTAYPAVLLLTGDHDGRVDPSNSRKMAARLQAATSSDHPILLRTSATSGHGIGTALKERIEQDTDVFAFLFQELGME